MELKFYYCKYCGKIIAIVRDGGTPTVCCGEVMSELIPAQTDGASEKHVPVIKVNGNHVSVMVGSTEHPMVAEHYIEWILLQTDMGIQKKWLKPGDEPKADFVIVSGEKVQAAYEYCNIHKLWKAG
ncbi:MAG: desulfoferrodoxin [Treponema sp.]|nr:desulfoferrodoxin [Treponema sp.]